MIIFGGAAGAARPCSRSGEGHAGTLQVRHGGVWSMALDLKTALAYARERHEGVLATISTDGRPQLSNVVYQIAADGMIVITSFASRRKIRNLLRDGRASLHITQPDFHAFVELDLEGSVVGPCGSADDAVTDRVAVVYERWTGAPVGTPHREALVRDQAVVVDLRAVRAYGLLAQ